MTRLSLPLADWPEQDRSAWEGLRAKGSLLRRGGVFAHLRPASLRSLSYSYGRWLAFCRDTAIPLGTTGPAERATDTIISAWAQSMAHLAWKSRSNHLQDLNAVLHAIAPDKEWPRLRDLAREAEWHATRQIRHRKIGRVLPTGMLLQAGLDHLAAVTGTDTASAIQYRDGLMVAALALLTLRHVNFRDLEIGRSFLPSQAGFDILLQADETKNHRILEKAVPERLVPCFKHYLEVHRPVLMRAARAPHNFLWVTMRGTRFSHHNLGARIATVTERLIGTAVSPHLFRDAAATTIAREDPSHARAMAGVLGHASLRTADRYYNQAGCLDASRTYGKLIEALAGPADQADGRLTDERRSRQ